MIRVGDILEHFLSRADWVDRNHTVDHIIVGDPDTRVDRCLVTWMPSFDALRATVRQGVKLLICHEPTFWNHGDDRPENSKRSTEKLQFIRDHGLVVLRNHDCWDRWPGIGIPWAWAQFLNLKGKPAAFGHSGYQHRYDIAPVKMDDFARHVAERCSTIGEPAVQVTGDGSRLISRIGIGTGCGCGIETYMEMGCDCSVVCDDGSCYWADIQLAKDLDHTVIRVNHGTSEEPGMVTMTRYINENIKGLTAEHLPHGCLFRLAGADFKKERAKARK